MCGENKGEERERGMNRSEEERKCERERVRHMCESESIDTILILVSLSMFDCINESKSGSFVDT